MRVLGLETVDLKDIRYDRRVIAPLIDSASQYKVNRGVFRCVVIDDGKNLVAGKLPLAAAISLGATAQVVCVVECNMGELKRIEAIEEHAANNQDGTHALVELVLEGLPNDGRRDGGQGGIEVSRRGEARRLVATMVARDPETVAKYDRDALKLPQDVWAPETFGLPVSALLLARIHDARRTSKEALGQIDTLLRLMSGANDRGLQHAPWAEFREVLLSLRASVTLHMPEGLCPFCKSWGWLVKYCPDCNKTGIGSATAYKRAPDALKDASKHVGYHGGRFYDLAVIPQE